jgi:protein-tyrosine phosphatase
MIDIHCHILPGLDDGAESLAVSIAMAEMAVADGVTHLVCTPHITPGVYHNTSDGIASQVAALQGELDLRGIPLRLAAGADIHISPTLVADLDAGIAPTLAGSRAILFEPPHHVLPPRMDQAVARLIAAGYVPVITHPERLSWIESRYDVVVALSDMGAPLQLTAGSITGGFGKRPQYWAERILDEGRADVIASDAHNTRARSPRLSHARDRVAARLGEAEAENLVLWRPAALLNGESLPARAGIVTPQTPDKGVGVFSSIRGWLNSVRG